jgi:4-diphosphocytidyl-2-C-methyl-D-erythritol kinase
MVSSPRLENWPQASGYWLLITDNFNTEPFKVSKFQRVFLLMLLLKSPAKINLFLHVTGRRPDGYHELFSLMCCISIFDHIQLDISGNDIVVDCAHPEVPLNDANLAYKAAERFYAAYNPMPAPGVHIRIDKKIPVAAGLGGGSSNAAAVLMGLNAHHGAPLTLSQLSDVGLSLGADVPFFLFGKPALATGIGEKLEAFDMLPDYHVVVISPGFAVSTATVFSQFNLRLTNPEKKPTKALLKNKGFIAPLHLHNDLETVTLKTSPEIEKAKKWLAETGALGALMSGSGPSVFGLFDTGQAARKAADILTERSAWQVFATQLILDPADLVSERS